MSLLKFVWAGIASLGLVACSTGGSRLSGEGEIDGYKVRWIAVDAFADRVPAGQTPVMFTFTLVDAARGNGVTQADWEAAAARFNLPVFDTRKILGSDVYKGPNGLGDIRACTQIAIARGFCGERPVLSLAQRVDYAQRVMASSTACQWTGFDRAYHSSAAASSGAVDRTLHVAASCGAR